MEGSDGGQHPAVDRQTTVEGSDGGLHPAVEGSDGGLHPAVDRRQWRVVIKGYIVQWMDKA